MRKLITIVSASLLVAGCFKTQVRAPQTARVGPTYEQRQWFTLGGLVGLSGEAGAECTEGVAYAESRMGGVDIAINVGLILAGSLVGAAVCDADAESDEYARCATGVGTLVPFIIGSRSVKYECRAASGISWMPHVGRTAPAKTPELSEEKAKPVDQAR